MNIIILLFSILFLFQHKQVLVTSIRLNYGECAIVQNKIYYVGGYFLSNSRTQISNSYLFSLSLNQTIELNQSVAPWQQENVDPISNLPSNMTLNNYNNDLLMLGGINRNNQNLFQKIYLSKNYKMKTLNIQSHPLFQLYFNNKEAYLNSISLIGHTFTQNNNNKNEFILYGGLISNEKNENRFISNIYIYNIKTDQWKLINNTQYQSILGHYSFYYQNQILSVYGYSPQLLALDKLTIFNLNTYKFQIQKLIGDIPPMNNYRFINNNNYLYALELKNQFIYQLNLNNLKWKKILLKNNYLFQLNLDSCLLNYQNYIIQSFGGMQLFTDETYLLDLQTMNSTNVFIPIQNNNNNNTSSNSTLNDLNLYNSITTSNAKSPWVLIGVLLTLSMFLFLLGSLIYIKYENKNKNQEYYGHHKPQPSYQLKPIWIDNTKSLMFDKTLVNLQYKKIDRDSKDNTILSVTSNHFIS
ncbi:hypothetical protein K502DRAFT_346242 [Neoconidiobolus thromboides FSU 785]|nr:hypothetical protein K502DRAFT_346242 [Neoconidiobolus thromboides FSU 785]